MAANARPTLLIDGDPQGSLALWQRVRGAQDLPLHVGTKHLAATLAKARRAGAEWVLIDTPPSAEAPVAAAIWHVDLVVIPMRPGLFDVDAVQATIQMCRELKKPYAVVINAAPAKNGSEDPSVADARGAMQALNVPTWSARSPTALSCRSLWPMGLVLTSPTPDRLDGRRSAAFGARSQGALRR
jgi:chromosome partitioning protein